ncbi:AAA-like domain [Cardinium endosymbiont of Sogatella furcifera]|uniref:VirB4 family type IV secretion system protein n=1 Tax=Cardinium endosymbiont of Sogatella furcifera TaxID=650378 RepID=UPI000E0DA3E5|nr:DUF87 domain-containing protein [Cardinium endosymbiont of Sogatella furcifera]AXI24020.1 AAA-like domain [Cardinium endosymbiont of Sogatella furcifera]
MLQEKYIENYIPIVEFQDGCIILEDGAVAIGYQLNLFPDEGVGEEVYKNCIDSLAQTIRRFPIGTVIQQLDSYSNKTFHTKIQNGYNFFHQKQLEHCNGHIFLTHVTYLFVICRPTTHSIEPHTTTFSCGKGYFKHPLSELKKTIDQVKKCSLELESAFPDGCQYRQLTASNNLSLLYAYLNLDFSGTIDGLEHGLTNQKGFFKIGNKQVAIVSMQSQSNKPDYTSKNGLGNGGGVTVPFTWGLSHYMNCPHIVVQAIAIQNTEDFLQSRSKALEWSQATKRNNREIRNVNQDMEELIAFEAAIRAQEEIIVTLNYLVILYEVDPKQLADNIEKVKKVFKKLDMAPFVEDYDTTNLYFSAIPGNGHQLYRGQPMALKTALSYFNKITPRKGADNGILLASRQQTPIYYDPFNLNLDNQNAFVFGPSGSGKSFFNGKMIKDRFQSGHIVIVIDSGGTYRRLFQILGGKYIEYNAATPLHLNPFLIKPESNGLFKPDINKITFLVQLIGKIWKGDLNTNPMSEVDKALLAGWIPEYYATLHKESVPSLTGFYDYLKKLVDQKDQQVKKLTDEGLFLFHEFFIVLHPFAHGIYKKHFNSYEQVYLEDHKLICFELEAIKNNPKLYPLVVQVLFEFAFEIVAQYPDVTKFIDIEEGWTMLDDYAEENIEAFFRKGRKTKTSIRIITQNIDEIKASKIAGAMKNNASTFILLYNEKKSSREDIGDFIGMTPFEMEKYESLRRKNGSDGYREVFIKEMGDSNIWLLQTSLWEHALLTSRPDERNAITRLIQEKGDAQLGIAEWVDGQRKLQAK